MTGKNYRKPVYIFALIFAFAFSAAAQTTEFTYQGKLTVQGAQSADYDFEFRLCDSLAADCTTPLATNQRLGVPVSSGAFTVKLDFGAAAFQDGSNRWLEIAVKSPGEQNFTTLDPRQPLTSAPFSIKSKSAEDSTKLGGVNASEYVTTSSVGNSFIKNSTTTQTANLNISGNGFFGNRLGIGTINPGAGLEVRGTGFGAGQRITDNTSGNSLVLQSGAGGNMKITGYNYNTAQAVPLFLSVDGANTILNSGGGNVGIGTTNPTTKLSVFSDFYGISQTDGTRTLSTFINSQGGWIGTTTNDPFHFFTNNGAALMTVMPAGNVGIGTTAPLDGYRLDVSGGTRTFGDAAHFVAQATGGTNSWARFYMRSASRSWFIGTSQNFNGNQLYIADETVGQTRMVVDVNGNVGIGTTNPTQKLEVAGTTKTGILQITGGSDLAENFEMADAERIKPGIIVAIDPKSAGKLILASGAYNRRVAGIISGANNLSAGMILPDLKEGEKSKPVALSGRVWVYADATKSAIQSGDLLTTSDMPGYAMKVKNYKRAQGAIIGKAMTELKSGTGLVLVLVSLQ